MTDKKGARGIAQPFNRPLAHVRQVKPVVAQLKTVGPPQSIKRPVAPPVYRPQPVPKVLQRKAAPVQHPQAPRQPIAPPVYRPQPKPAIAQAKMAANSQTRKTPTPPRNSTVQRYTEADIKELGGAGILSQNENYFIPHGDTRILFAEEKAAVPRGSDPVKSKAKDYKTKKYREYKSKKFYKDCLHTAEEIINNQNYKPGSGVRSQVHGGASEAFGEDYKSNINLAKKYAADEGAAPDAGQAYVIVRKSLKRKAGDYPYHAAGVVAVDGSDRITLEVSATDSDARKRTTYGEYKMYTTGAGVGKTFHDHWKDQFGGDWATLVIEPKT